MSENNNAKEWTTTEIELDRSNSTPVKDFLNKHKKTLITVGVTAATTTLAVLWAKKESDEDYDYDEEDEDEVEDN